MAISINERIGITEFKCGLEKPGKKCPTAQSDEGKNCTRVFECFVLSKSEIGIGTTYAAAQIPHKDIKGKSNCLGTIGTVYKREDTDQPWNSLGSHCDKCGPVVNTPISPQEIFDLEKHKIYDSRNS